MKHKKVVLLAVILSALVIAACGAGAAQRGPAPQPTMVAVREAGVVDENSPSGGDVAVSQAETQGGRMVIRSSQMSIIVEDVEVALPKVMDLISRMQGYVVTSNSYRTYSDRLAATITLRVPEAQFNEALGELRQLGKVQTESLAGQDVTDQYVDFQARLTVREATEQELLGLLSEVRQGTGNAEEKATAILDIYNQLTAVRTEIEQIRGQMQYLEQMSAMATITVELTPREQQTSEPAPSTTFNPLRTLRSAGQALLNVLKWLLGALIWLLVVLVPVAIIVLLPVALIIWALRRWRQRRTQKAAVEQQGPSL